MCNGDADGHELSKGDQIANIMAILNMSEKQLDDCTDPKSIRMTCRNVVRVIYKTQLADNSKSYGKMLKNKKHKPIFKAIRGNLND